MTKIRSTVQDWKTGVKESWRAAVKIWRLPSDDFI